MTTILEFPERVASAKSKGSKSRAGRASAEIVIFPGVRIERWEEPPAPASAPARKRRKKRASVSRDRLELLD